MAIISVKDLTIGFRGPSLLDDASCEIEAGQKIGLLGRNGAGKTTFMRLLCGDVVPDHGTIALDRGIKLALLSQDLPKDLSGTIHEVVSSGAISDDEPEAGWEAQQAVERTLSQMELDPQARFETLSTGMKRRVLLARALASSPDVLLLDEPTNHLDISAITWLEDFFKRWRGTLIFVTHDRQFLQNLATRILEIERAKLFDWSCDYATFLSRKESALAAQEKQDALFDKKLAEEEAWVRTGIKARRTRNEGRVRRLMAMRNERGDRRNDQGTARIRIQEAERSGNLVAHLKNVTFMYDNKPILIDLSTFVMRGDKVGIIGPNGVGKSTLLRILLGKLEPQQGEVRLGTNLQISYFDQLRAQLNEEATVKDNVGDGYDTIKVGGQSKNIIGYLQDFLFSPDRAQTPVKFLSGGERNRILLAKLFAKPSNLIVLDEPTNDLDSETLELLEARLVDFGGTVLLVSHDRQFLNNVVTSCLVFENGTVNEYVGGYDDWQRQVRNSTKAAANTRKQESATKSKPKLNQQDSKQRLSYKERQELESLPSLIENLEAEISRIHSAMADPSFFKQPGNQLAQDQAKLKTAEDQLAQAFERWEELASKA